MIDHYDWAGGREAMIRLGPDHGPVVVFALPLLEEHNRTRAFVMTIMRELATRGIASALPDLPSTGESVVPLADVSLSAWRGAFAAASVRVGGGRRVLAAAIRGGALVDVAADVTARWHLAPLTGTAQARELIRLHNMGLPPGVPKQTTENLAACDGTLDIAGNDVACALLPELAAAMPAEGHVVRLTGDPAPADAYVDGQPLWRRAEPGNDSVFAQRLADDIADWVARCGEC